MIVGCDSESYRTFRELYQLAVLEHNTNTIQPKQSQPLPQKQSSPSRQSSSTRRSAQVQEAVVEIRALAAAIDEGVEVVSGLNLMINIKEFKGQKEKK